MATSLIHAERFLAGPNLWSNNPALLASLRHSAWSAGQIAQTLARLVRALPEMAEHAVFRRQQTLPAAVIALADALSRAIGASWGRSRLMPGVRGEVRLLIACPHERLAHALAAGVNQILTAVSRGDRPATRVVLAELLAIWECPAEAALLAQAAHKRRLPVAWLDPEQSWLVLGQGAHSRIYHRGYFSSDGALRDVADDKLATASLLERAGVPTTNPMLVATADEAVALASALGLPVVLKPNRGWAQVGVWTNLRSLPAVRAAFRRAAAQAGPLGGPLLIERQRAGRYLRATLVGGRLRAVLTCEAPTATGDGRRTAEALAKEFYHLPSHEKLDLRSRGILEAVLSQQKLKPDTVPARGLAFRVGHDNQGRASDVTATVHRSLTQLLNRVGRLFAGPVLGVDLLVRDPAAPFDPAHDVIIEVNPAPGFAQHERTQQGPTRNLAGPILAHLFPTPTAARIPVVAAPAGYAAELEEMAQALRRRGVYPTGYTRGTVWSGTPRRELGRGPHAASLLLLDAQAEVLLIEVDEDLAGVGLPVDRVDFLLARPARKGPLASLLARLHSSSRNKGASVEDIRYCCGTLADR